MNVVIGSAVLSVSKLTINPQDIFLCHTHALHSYLRDITVIMKNNNIIQLFCYDYPPSCDFHIDKLLFMANSNAASL